MLRAHSAAAAFNKWEWESSLAAALEERQVVSLAGAALPEAGGPWHSESAEFVRPWVRVG